RRFLLHARERERARVLVRVLERLRLAAHAVTDAHPDVVDARAHHLADHREPGLPDDDRLRRRERAREDGTLPRVKGELIHLLPPICWRTQAARALSLAWRASASQSM